MSESATLSIAGVRSKLGEFDVASEHKLQIELPKLHTKTDLARIQRDCEILGEILKSQPDKVVELLQAARSNDREKAQRLARELKLTEADFLAQEGGFVGLVIVIILILIVAGASPAQ